jgi:hypothetical protein
LIRSPAHFEKDGSLLGLVSLIVGQMYAAQPAPGDMPGESSDVRFGPLVGVGYESIGRTPLEYAGGPLDFCEADGVRIAIGGVVAWPRAEWWELQGRLVGSHTSLTGETCVYGHQGGELQEPVRELSVGGDVMAHGWLDPVFFGLGGTTRIRWLSTEAGTGLSREQARDTRFVFGVAGEIGAGFGTSRDLQLAITSAVLAPQVEATPPFELGLSGCYLF